MKKIDFVVGIIVALLILSPAGISFAWQETEISSKVRLPTNIEIIQPSPDLPKNVAAFSGRWEGVWESDLACVLVVEKIYPYKREMIAEVVYAWGYHAWGKEDYIRRKAKIRGPRPRLEFSSSYAEMEFEMAEDGSLNGTHDFFSRSGPYRPLTKAKIKMYKVE